MVTPSDGCLTELPYPMSRLSERRKTPRIWRYTGLTGIFFKRHRRELNWRAIAGGDRDFGLDACWGSRELGHIDLTEYDAKHKVMYVLHFATWKENRRLKIEGLSAGRAMAFAFRDCLQYNLNCRRIVFRENHSEYLEIGYARFFNALGAVPRQSNHHPNRAAWHWDWTGTPVGGEYWLGKHDVLE